MHLSPGFFSVNINHHQMSIVERGNNDRFRQGKI